MLEERTLLDGLIYPEGPRWHEDHLYVADFYAGEIVRCDLQGGRDIYMTVPAQPSGMGWLPDGRLQVVSMRDARILLYDGQAVTVAADLSGSTPCANEMVVDPQGRAYVGGMRNVYTDKRAPAEIAAGGGDSELENLYLVEPGSTGEPSRVRIVATDLNFPNGTVITPDGKTLIIAESMAQQLTAFDIAEDGALFGRRSWAKLCGVPDGICLDADGCVWVAICFPEDARGFYRVAEGGDILDKIATQWVPMAVALGGPDRNHIFLVESRVVGTGDESGVRDRGNGRVRVGRVTVPGAGIP
jgi:sugar lactone lactonase YvrE